MFDLDVGLQRQRGHQLKPGRFAALRSYAGWTQRKIAELTGVTERTVARWEKSDVLPLAAWMVFCANTGVTMIDDATDWIVPPKPKAQ